jgi:hypothetical protein
MTMKVTSSAKLKATLIRLSGYGTDTRLIGHHFNEGAAVRTWFVRLERFRADGYILDEPH